MREDDVDQAATLLKLTLARMAGSGNLDVICLINFFFQAVQGIGYERVLAAICYLWVHMHHIPDYVQLQSVRQLQDPNEFAYPNPNEFAYPDPNEFAFPDPNEFAYPVLPSDGSMMREESDFSSIDIFGQRFTKEEPSGDDNSAPALL